MNTLKIKIKFGDVEVELEGETTIVQKEFRDLKENGLGNLITEQLAPDSAPKNQQNQQVTPPAQTKKILPPKKEKSTESKPKGKGKAPGFKLLTDLNYRPKGKDSLIDFINNLPFKSNVEKIAGIVYYCKETLGIEQVTSDHIFTGFKELKIPIPPTLYQVIVNVKNRNGWINFDKMEDITYTIQGGNFIEHDLPKRKVNGKS